MGADELHSENAEHRQRQDRVDEDAVSALEVHRARRVGFWVLALSDVATGRLHRDHVPRQERRELHIEEHRVPTEEAAAA